MESTLSRFMIGCFAFLMILSGFSGEGAFLQAEEREVHPYSAALRSALVPGWGYTRIGHPVQGMVSTLFLAGAVTGGLIVRSAYLDVYDQEYTPAALQDPDSPEALDAFNRANQRYKLSQFLFFTALGIWAYGVVDTYVGAHIYNAELKAARLEQQPESQPILKMQIHPDSMSAHIGLTF